MGRAEKKMCLGKSHDPNGSDSENSTSRMLWSFLGKRVCPRLLTVSVTAGLISDSHHNSFGRVQGKKRS